MNPGAEADRALVQLLGSMTPAEFMARHWTTAAYAAAGSAASWAAACDWPLLERLVERTPCDILVARGGVRHPGLRPTRMAEVRALLADGWSVVARQAHRHDAVLAAMAGAVSRAFHGPINLQIYATPAGKTSFGWHYDAEDVFLIQAQGAKRWLVRRNTVLPQPPPEGLQAEAPFARERSPIQECLMAPGDLLYIPGGWWHAGTAEGDALSISIGVMAQTVFDVLAGTIAGLARDPLWRRRLPTSGAWGVLSDEARDREWQAALAALAHALGDRLQDPALPAQVAAHAQARAQHLDQPEPAPGPGPAASAS